MIEHRIMSYEKYNFHKMLPIDDIDNITLDYDVPFLKFPYTERYNTVKKFIREYPIVVQDDVGPYGWIRKSSSGKVHVKIELTDKIPMLEHLVLRAMLRDDRERLNMDLIRLYEHSQINILFEKKYVNNKVIRATEWIKFRGD